MSHVHWALLAMAAYSATFVLAKLAMRGVPSFVVMSASVAIVFACSVGAALAAGQRLPSTPAARDLAYTLACGLSLAIAVVGYFQALRSGPASVVVPIYGMFVVGGSALGVLVLGEELSVAKAVGVCGAAGSILLIARSG